MRYRVIPLAPFLISLGLLLMGAPLVSAQDAPVAGPSITVVGYGEASVPAETARIQLTVSGNTYGPPPVPRPGATPGAEERESVAPVVAALVDAGIEEDQIEVLVGPSIGDWYAYSGPAIAVLRFSLDSPDLARITEIVDAASVGAADEGLLIGPVGALYEVADCSPLERDAREAAITQARANVDVQAELLGVTTGNVVGSRDIPVDFSLGSIQYGGVPPDQGCSPLVDAGPSLRLAPIDPTIEPMVTVRMQVEVSFEITEVDVATPES